MDPGGVRDALPSIGIIRTGTKGLSQPGNLPSTPALKLKV